MSEQVALDIKDDYVTFRELSLNGFEYFYNVWRFTGLWTLPDDWFIYRVYSRFTQFTCLGVFNVFILMSMLDADNMNDIIEILIPLTTTILVALKAFAVVWKKNSWKQLFAISKDLDAASDPDERAILDAANRSNRKLLIALSVGCYSSIGSRVVQACMSPRRELMWNTWWPFDWVHATSGVHHIIALSFQIVSNAFIGILYTTVDCQGPHVYNTMSAFLDVLAHRLTRLGDPRHTVEANERKLIDCVKYHTLILKYNAILHDIFAVHYAIQFFASGIVICVIAFQLSTVQPSDTTNFVFLLLYFVNMGIEVLIPCYYGSRLTAKSARLCTEVFRSNWTDSTKRFKSAMLMFMQGVRNPIELYTFSKLFKIALPTFVTICRAAYSLLSCLRGV